MPDLQGYLLPAYHKQYWIGAYATTWPVFRYSDPLLGITVSLANNYTNWANDTSGNSYPLTNGYNCATAQYTLAFDPNQVGTSDGNWGWVDSPCNATFTSMCRISGERGIGMRK